MTNGLALLFGHTNGMRLPSWLSTNSNDHSHWTQGEVFAVIQSFGKTANGENGLWLLGHVTPTYVPTREGYPYDDGNINESFGRGESTAIAIANGLTVPHLYNVMASAGDAGSWKIWHNGLPILSTNNVRVDFGTDNYLGTAGDSCGYWGYMWEIMIFNRDLTADERDTLNKYLNKRYNLWN